MTPPQMADLLNLISSTDGRNLTQQMPSAWMDIIGDLDFTDAKAAVVKHFQQSTEWLMPAHVRKGVKSMREKRLLLVGGAQLNDVDERLENPREYNEARRELLDAIASGRLSADEVNRYRESDLTFREWSSRELSS